MNKTTEPVSVLKFALGAVIMVLALNLVLRILLKLEGVPVTIGAAIGVAGLVAAWFVKSIGRVPTSRERSRFLWLYSGILALAFVALVLLASRRGAPDAAALFVLLLHYLPYPAFAQMFLSEEFLGKLFKQ